MPVVNVQPDGRTVRIVAGEISGQLRVFNTGAPNPDGEDTEYDYQIGETLVQHDSLAPEGVTTLLVNGQQFRIDNDGPSVLQLSY